MNNITSNRFKYLAPLFISLLLFASCGGSDDPQPDPEDPQVAATKLLTANSWLVNSVTKDNTDVSSEYTGFSVTFTDIGYSTQNGSSAWDAGGAWSWANSTTTTEINLDTGIFLQISFGNSNTALTCNFTVPETVYDTGGRTYSLQGNYVFVLKK